MQTWATSLEPRIGRRTVKKVLCAVIVAFGLALGAIAPASATPLSKVAVNVDCANRVYTTGTASETAYYTLIVGVREGTVEQAMVYFMKGDRINLGQVANTSYGDAVVEVWQGQVKLINTIVSVNLGCRLV